MPVFRDKSTGKGTFAGTMGAAMARHTAANAPAKDKFQSETDAPEGTNEENKDKDAKHAEIKEHLHKAKEHLDKASKAHGGFDQDDEAAHENAGGQGPGIMGGVKSSLGM